MNEEIYIHKRKEKEIEEEEHRKIEEETPEKEKCKKKKLEEEIKLKVPVIVLKRPDVEINEPRFDMCVPSIEIRERKLQIPILRLSVLKKVKTIIEKLDGKIPEITEKRERLLRVPVYKISSLKKIQGISSFDTVVHPTIKEKFSSTKAMANERIEIKENVRFTESSTIEHGEKTPEEKSNGEIYDPFEKLFEGFSGEGFLAEGTKIICFKESSENSYIGSFVTLCRRIYREKCGGNPDFQLIEKIDEINKTEIERWLNSNKKVIIIDLDSNKKIAKIDMELLKERLEATYGKIGFIIFKKNDNKLWENLNKNL